MQFDVLIIGSGVAGLLVALHLNKSFKVAIVAKSELDDGSTSRAQGGVSAVLDEEDCFDLHIQDTINAGGGLCNPEVVKQVVTSAPEAIDFLQSLGVEFSGNQQKLHLSQEGGHSKRRVVHAKDATGIEISYKLIQKVKTQANISIFTNHIAIDLVTNKKDNNLESKIYGAYILDINNDEIKSFVASNIILATGGASKVYLYSSNPDGSTGDGIAMAWRAGCAVSNMEFNQFHPTCLFHPHAKSFLISEALRGEGAHLVLPDGARFVDKFDARGDLAPRDIVARAIDHEMKRLGVDSVFLDISFKSKDFLKQHFPLITKKLKKYGFNLSDERIPVVPAAHYTCGGVMVDQVGETNIKGLYAIGEVSATGMHGANRLASNSLLECMVFARLAACDINQNPKSKQNSFPDWDESRVIDSDEMVVVSHNWDELRRFMWDYVGIVRTNKRLERAKHRVSLLQEEISEYYGNFKVHSHLLELRNLVQVAEIMVDSALSRQESRGLHYNLDFPETNHIAQNTVLILGE